MNKKAIYVTVCGLIAAFVGIRVGKYLVDYTRLNPNGEIVTPFIPFGLAFMYAGVTVFLIIFVTVGAKKFSVSFGTFRELILLLIVAMGINSFLFIRNPNFSADAYEYVIPVFNFMHGKGYTMMGGEATFLPPGYGIISSILSFVINDIAISAMLIPAFSYVFSIGIAYYIGIVLGGRFSGFLAAFFITFCPWIISYSFISFNYLLYIFLALLSFSVLISILLKKPDYGRSFLLGFLLGYIGLTREEGVVLVVGVIFFWFLLTIMMLLKQKQFKWAAICKQISYPTSTLIIIAILIFLQMYPVYSKTGYWVISGRVYRYLYPRKAARINENTESGSPRVDNQDKQSVSMLDYTLFPWTRFRSNVGSATKTLVHIAIHAIVPLIVMIGAWGLYALARLMSRKKFLSRWKIRSTHVKLLCCFLIFVSPMGVPIATHKMRFSYIMTHSVLFFILLALMIVRLLTLICKRHVVYGIVGVCILAFLAVFGVVNKTELFRNRFLSRTHLYFTKQSMNNLREVGVPEEVVESLKDLKYRTFYEENAFLKAVEEYAGQEQTGKYQKQILKTAIYPEPYTTLPQVLKAHYRESPFNEALQAAGALFRHTYPGDMKTIKIFVMCPKINKLLASMIVFYANGRSREPEQGQVVILPIRFMLTAGALNHLENEGVPEHLVEALEPLKGLTFTNEKNTPKIFWDNLAKRLGVDYTLKYQQQIYQHAVVSEDIQLDRIVEAMQADQIDYLLLLEMAGVMPLWENPDLADEVDLKFIHHDPQGRFQLYSLEH